MPEPPPDGLASLQAKRARARRTMPPPRHPAGRAAAVASEPASEPEPSEPTTVAGPPPVTDAGESPRPSPQITEATVPVTLHIDRQADEFLEAARVAGLTARPKVDVSRSAVARLALRRLMDEMGPQEVKEVLERQAVRTGSPGRKRR